MVLNQRPKGAPPFKWPSKLAGKFLCFIGIHKHANKYTRTEFDEPDKLHISTSCERCGLFIKSSQAKITIFSEDCGIGDNDE